MNQQDERKEPWYSDLLEEALDFGLESGLDLLSGIFQAWF